MSFALNNALLRWALSIFLAFGLSYLIWSFIFYGFCPGEWGYTNRLFSVLLAAGLFLIINSRLTPSE